MSQARLEAALENLPIFPLPNAVLFPQAHLELHVFEPRYRAMLDVSLRTHRHLAIAQIVGTAGPGGAPRIAVIAGVGSIERHERLPDGRSHIVLVGRARAVLDELPFVAPFRRARGRLVPDVDDEAPTPTDELMLVTAMRSFVEALRQDGPTITFDRPEGIPAGELAQHAAQHLVFDGRVKQEILEMRSARERVERVASELLAQRTQLLGAPSASRSN